MKKNGKGYKEEKALKKGGNKSFQSMKESPNFMKTRMGDGPLNSWMICRPLADHDSISVNGENPHNPRMSKIILLQGGPSQSWENKLTPF